MRLRLILLAITCSFAVLTQGLYAQSLGSLGFTYGQGEQAPDGTGKVDLEIAYKLSRTKADDKKIGPNKVIDFKGRPVGYVKFSFKDLELKDDVVNAELGFNGIYFKSSPNYAQPILPKGVTFLKAGKGKRAIEVLFEITKNGPYNFRVGFGVITAPNAPPDTSVTATFSDFTVKGIVAKEVIIIDTVPAVVEEEPDDDGSAPTVDLGSEAERDRLWFDAQRYETAKAYRRFLERERTGGRARAAREKLVWQGTKKTSGAFFRVYYEYLNFDSALVDRDFLRVEIVDENTEEELDPELYEWSGDTLLVSLPDDKRYLVRARDRQNFAMRDTIPLKLGITDLNVKYWVDRENDKINLEVLGGEAPYQLIFVSRAKGKALRVEYPDKLTEQKFSLDRQTVIDLLELLDGNYTLDVIDNLKEKYTGKMGVLMQRQARFSGWFWIVGGGFIVGLFIMGGLMRRRQQKEYEEMSTLLEQRLRYSGTGEEEEQEAGIRIKRRTLKNRPLDEMEEEEQEIDFSDLDRFIPLEMSSIWEDSVVTDLHLDREFVQEINTFLQESTAALLAPEEDDETVPEIGGFMMGMVSIDKETEKYQVSLEKFVPITPEANDRYHIVFGGEAWTELAEAQDEFPHLKMVGWFHTHPGHGLFLSLPDQKIHEGHFKEPYQIAMEIDTLMPNLDTAFFTWRSDGKVNNQQDKKVPSSWFKWKRF